MKTNQVILVDEHDVPKGTMEKMEAHKKGELHRAFSIFIFNSEKKLLLQKRALHKYHSGGLWTNTCCSHPEPEKNLIASAQKRLIEEMGFDCVLEQVFNIIYKAELNNNLIEHELDHVFIGHYNEIPKINKEEVSEWKYMPTNEIQQSLKQNPELYTAWFKIIFPKVIEFIEK